MWNGIWTKWVLERCSEDQQALFYKLRDTVDSMGLDYLSDNSLLRFLKSFHWNIQTASQKLAQTEKWRRENNCMDIDPKDIQREFDMNFAYIYGYDKVGRSILWMKGKNLDPSKTTHSSFARFITYVID